MSTNTNYFVLPDSTHAGYRPVSSKTSIPTSLILEGETKGLTEAHQNYQPDHFVLFASICHLSSSLKFWSDETESNCRFQYIRLMCYHYTTVELISINLVGFEPTIFAPQTQRLDQTSLQVDKFFYLLCTTLCSLLCCILTLAMCFYAKGGTGSTP